LSENYWCFLEKVVKRRPTAINPTKEMEHAKSQCTSERLCYCIRAKRSERKVEHGKDCRSISWRRRWRNVKVKTTTGTYSRPINKICVIYPAEGYDEEWMGVLPLSGGVFHWQWKIIITLFN
jgi:hypothetical protein